MRGIDLPIDFAEKLNFPAQNGEIQKLGFEGIVDIGGVVGDYINAIDELGFQRRAQIQKIFGKLRKLRGGIITRMLDDAFAHFKREIQTRIIEIALFELFDDAQRVQIVIERGAAPTHQFVELAFTGVAEGRMADVVNKRERFGKLGVQSECGSNRAGNLRDLESVRQAIAEMVRIARSK